MEPEPQIFNIENFKAGEEFGHPIPLKNKNKKKPKKGVILNFAS